MCVCVCVSLVAYGVEDRTNISGGVSRVQSDEELRDLKTMFIRTLPSQAFVFCEALLLSIGSRHERYLAESSQKAKQPFKC